MTWREVFHRGLVPELSIPALRALRDGLRENDPTLIQGETGTTADGDLLSPLCGACAAVYGPWRAGEILQGAGAQDLFLRLHNACGGSDIRHFTNWFDRTPRAEAIALLLPEVEAALAARA